VLEYERNRNANKGPATKRGLFIWWSYPNHAGAYTRISMRHMRCPNAGGTL